MVIFFVFFVFLGVLLTPFDVTGYRFVQKLTITNPGATVSDEDFNFFLNSQILRFDGKMMFECEDIRVLDSAFELLPHFLESECGDSSLSIWATATTMLSGVNYFYVAYGHDSAADISLTFSHEYYVLQNGLTCPDGYTWDTTIPDGRFLRGSTSSFTPVAGGNANFDHWHYVTQTYGECWEKTLYDVASSGGLMDINPVNHLHSSISSGSGLNFPSPLEWPRYSMRLCFKGGPLTVLPSGSATIWKDTAKFTQLQSESKVVQADVGSNGYYLGASDRYKQQGQVDTSHDHSHGAYDCQGEWGYAVKIRQLGDPFPNTENYFHYHTIPEGYLSSATPTLRHVKVILGTAQEDLPISGNMMLFLATGVPPIGWEADSTFSQRFLMLSSTGGGIGGSDSHEHSQSVTTDWASDDFEDYFTSEDDYEGCSVNHKHAVDLLTEFKNHNPEYSDIFVIKQKTSMTVVNSPSEIPICNGVFTDGEITNGLACSGHGYCVDTDLCDCEPDFGGSDCSEWTCYGVLHDNIHVCTGHGDCTRLNNCSCHENYSGERCDEFRCFGKSSSSPLACSKHGQCVNPDVCDCESSSYFGPNCDNWSCFGKNRNGSSVCSGSGVCLDVDLCYCDMYVSGVECESFYCFGASKDDSAACSSHGQCLSHNNCSCVPNYVGTQCETWTCDGYGQYEIGEVCNGHGACKAYNSCDCHVGYSGQFCGRWTCWGVGNHQSDAVCSTHGECLRLDYCYCDTQYYSSLCNEYYCFGKFMNSSDVCSSHGSCIESNNCDCDFGYTGFNCHEWSCFGYDKSLPEACSRNGACIDFDTCDCYSNYTGTQCEIFQCFGKWTNNESAADPICNGHGSCIDEDLCSCDLFYSGIECGEYECDGISAKVEEEVCNGHGQCVSKDVCVCDDNYKGLTCASYSCFGVSSSSPLVCSSKGNCSGINTCDCSGSYFGESCSLYECNDILFSSEKVCSSHGKCMSPDDCLCDPTHVGRFCDVYACFGIAHDHINACNRCGNCVAIDTCECTRAQTYGNECQESIFDAHYEGRETIIVQFNVPTRHLEGLDLFSYSLCERLVKNLDDFVGTTTCSFVSNVATTQFLKISLSENQARKKQFVSKIKIHPVTDPETTVDLRISGHPDDEKTDGKSTGFWLSKVVAPVGGGAVFLIVCVCSISTIVICILGALYKKKQKFVKKVKNIRDIDVLMEEAQVENKDPKLTLNKKLFEIPENDLTLKQQIGSGGSGACLFLADSKSIGKQVCAKIFPGRAILDHTEDFEKEISIHLSLSHPNILQVFGCQLSGKRISIIMEYCVNGSVESYLQKSIMGLNTPIKMKEKVRWLCEICSALNYITGKGIVHRDLKLDNTLLNELLQIKLIDFGLSRYMQRGTMTKMAPEITLGRKYDFKVDIFSLSIIMWVFLTDDVMPYGSKFEDLHNIEVEVARNPNKRPLVDEENVPKGIIKRKYVPLMKKNWNHSPESRYNFEETLKILKQIQETL